jgi:hypothetical protein
LDWEELMFAVFWLLFVLHIVFDYDG